MCENVSIQRWTDTNPIPDLFHLVYFPSEPLLSSCAPVSGSMWMMWTGFEVRFPLFGTCILEMNTLPEMQCTWQQSGLANVTTPCERTNTSTCRRILVTLQELHSLATLQIQLEKWPDFVRQWMRENINPDQLVLQLFLLAWTFQIKRK